MTDPEYDTSWNLQETEDRDIPGDRTAYKKKFDEWYQRDWMTWLDENLNFPFTAERIDDDGDAYFREGAREEPFRLGHVMDILEIAFDDEGKYGIMVTAKEGKKLEYVPLADLEVTPKSDGNYWPVREYNVWFANRNW